MISCSSKHEITNNNDLIMVQREEYWNSLRGVLQTGVFRIAEMRLALMRQLVFRYH